MKYILSIDQGTTGSRAVIYDKKGKAVASAYEEFPQHFPRPGWVEHDPRDIWQSVYNSMQRALSKIPKDAISCIGITNQRETTIIWDRVTGKPIYNAIVWQCRRTAGRCEALAKNKKLAGRIRGKTGLPVDAYFSATKIEWILSRVPGAMKKAKQGRLCFGTSDSWILWNLTGGKSHATDYTNASRTMLFNIKKKTWDNDLLRLFKVPAPVLPEVRKSSGMFGSTVKCGRLKAGIPVTGIAGDQQAALFGQACFFPGTIKNTYGTGSFVLLNTGKKCIASKYGLITTLGCGAKGEPAYVLEGAVFIAGAAVQWLRDGLKLIKTAKETETQIKSIRDTGGVYFVPAFVGLGAPYWNQNARGLITGITRGTNVSHFIRAALESMAYQTKDVLDAMRRDSGLSIRELKVDGGAVENNFLCQFQAEILGIPVVRPKVIESTSLGAAYLAGLFTCYWKSSADISRNWQRDREFKPKMKKEISAILYAGWKKAIEKTVLV
ncbi:MAG: glycerol kinase GlpK [Endomicrobiales bacterium]|nr:glycerol kinase GlpK [Endomicrobiales bacterium]